MEPANFHHHHQEDHEPVESSSFSTPSCYGLAWSQNPLLNGTNNMIINSRNLVPCLDTSTNSMVQDLGYRPIENFMTHKLQRLARIKDEFSVSESYPNFLDMLNCSPTASIEDLHLHPSSSYVKNDHHQQVSYLNNNQDFLLTTFSTGYQIKGGRFINDDQNCSDGIFSQIFPTINISSLNQSSSSSSSPSSSSAISSSSFDMNSLPTLDLYGSPRFDGSFSHPSSLNAHNLGGFSYGLINRMHQPSHRPSVCPSKISSVSTSTDQSAKRPASKYIDAKSTQSVAPKKSKLEPRPASSAPFQVRKEKLGDRIAAIQQLVAPFGKTDTASVLMEAIGYIKFLQTQVETLSMPYMKSTNKTSRIPTQVGRMEEGNIEAKRDLRSRGLCLVPLTYLSYVTDGSEGIWPKPKYDHSKELD